MSATSPTNCMIGVTLTAGLMVYSIGHTYKFDRCKCLIPRRKNLVRTAIVWLELVSCLSFMLWIGGLTILKYNLGYTYIKGYGYVSFPPIAWPAKWLEWNLPLTCLLLGAFSAYDCINIEEVCFWANMIRAVRKSNKTTASRWLSRHIVLVWLILSMAQMVVHFGVGLVGLDPTDPYQLEVEDERIFLMEASFGAVTCILSVCLAFVFPNFIREVKNNGGSPDILAKLAFFNSMNRVRIVLRFIFSAGMFIIGIDGTTKAKTINSTPVSSDLLFQVVMICFIAASVISFMLYLPVSWSGTNLDAGQTFTRRRPGHRQQSYFGGPPGVTVIPPYADSATTVSTKASDQNLLQQFKAQHQNQTILELMRSRGTIKDAAEDGHGENDEEEKDFENGPDISPFSRGTHREESQVEDAERGQYDHAYPSAVYHDGSADGYRAPGSTLPAALLHFQSPLEFDIGDSRRSRTQPRPRDVVITVAQETETHIDVDTLHSPGVASSATYSRD